ncbi:hypothetical protein MRX96_048399 [Rhipicephalus microplus]
MRELIFVLASHFRAGDGTAGVPSGWRPFVMAVTDDVFLLAPIGFGLGGISSSLDMLPAPVLQRYIVPDAVERHLGISRAASGIWCLLGPVLVSHSLRVASIVHRLLYLIDVKPEGTGVQW